MKKLIVLLFSFTSFVSAYKAQAATVFAEQERPKKGYHHTSEKRDEHRKGSHLNQRDKHDQKKSYSKAEDRASRRRNKNHNEGDRACNR